MTAEEYIIEQVKKRIYIDVLDADFIDGFIKLTGAKYKDVCFGAYKCPAAGRLLSDMYKRNILKRYACGLGEGYSSMGFPKWVYSYSLR